jgi:hypothetical protein
MVFWQFEDRRLNILRNKVPLWPFPVLLPHPLCSWEASHRNQNSSLKWVIETTTPHLSPAPGPGHRNATITHTYTPTPTHTHPPTHTHTKQEESEQDFQTLFVKAHLNTCCETFLRAGMQTGSVPWVFFFFFFFLEASHWPLLAKLICYASFLSNLSPMTLMGDQTYHLSVFLPSFAEEEEKAEII